MEKKIKAVIIGCGNIGCDLDKYNPGFVVTHLSAYKRNSKIDLVGVCDIDIEKAKEISEKEEIPFYSDNIHEIMKKTNPEVVSICTPDKTHYNVLKEIVDFECVKGIWCEKPIAVTIEQAENMKKLCDEGEIKLLINYYRRYDTFYEELKLKLKELIGETQAVSCYYSGGIVTNGSHILDLLCYFFGKCKYVHAINNSYEEGNFNDLRGMLVFENGIFVSLISCSNKNFSVLEADFIGTKARLDIINKPFGRYDYRYYVKQKDNVVDVNYLGSESHDVMDKNLERDFFEKALEDLLFSIDNHSIPKSLADSIHVVEIICALVFSAQNKGCRVDLPFNDKKFIIPEQQGDIKKWKS